MTGTALGQWTVQEECQRCFRPEAAHGGPGMAHTQVSLGLEILIGRQFKIRSYHIKTQKSGFSLRSQKIEPSLELSGGHPSPAGLAGSPESSPHFWL